MALKVSNGVKERLSLSEDDENEDYDEDQLPHVSGFNFHCIL